MLVIITVPMLKSMRMNYHDDGIIIQKSIYDTDRCGTGIFTT